MVLCHSCVYQEKDLNGMGKAKYTSPSPDELAILKGVKSLGAYFLGDIY